MSVWYYAGADRQQQGPLPSEDLARLFHQGSIRLDTLIWREGQAEWQPLRDFSDELSLHQPSSEHFYTVATPLPQAPAAPVYASAAVVHDGDVVLAGFWKRLAASIIDGIVMTVAMLVVLAVGFAVLGGFGAFSGGMQSSDVMTGALGLFFILGVYVIPIILQAIYYTWMHASGSQATLGKMAVGIKVTRGDGTPLAMGRSFGRWAAYFFFNLASCGIATVVSAFMVGLTERKQGLHDMVADTLVVDRWAFTAHPERQREELGGVTIAVIALGILLGLGYFALLFFAGVMAGMNS